MSWRVARSSKDFVCDTTHSKAHPFVLLENRASRIAPVVRAVVAQVRSSTTRSNDSRIRHFSQVYPGTWNSDITKNAVGPHLAVPQNTNPFGTTDEFAHGMGLRGSSSPISQTVPIYVFG